MRNFKHSVIAWLLLAVIAYVLGSYASGKETMSDWDRTVQATVLYFFVAGCVAATLLIKAKNKER
jgi:uncharacterized membrane protein YoaK (UPF0700 family)